MSKSNRSKDGEPDSAATTRGTGRVNRVPGRPGMTKTKGDARHDQEPGFQFRKLDNSLSPAAWLFSGWNWTATMLP